MKLHFGLVLIVVVFELVYSQNQDAPGNQPRSYSDRERQDNPGNQQRNYPERVREDNPGNQPRSYSDRERQDNPGNQQRNYPERVREDNPGNQQRNYPDRVRDDYPGNQQRNYPDRERQDYSGNGRDNYVGYDGRNSRHFRIIRYENNVDTNRYNFRFETEDPYTREEEGYWIGTGEFGPDGEELGINHVKGNSDFNLRDGTPFHLTFEADQLGYRPHFTIGAPLTGNRPDTYRSRSEFRGDVRPDLGGEPSPYRPGSRPVGFEPRSASSESERGQ